MPSTIEQLIQVGIEKESRTEDFYRYWSQKLDDPRTRVLMLALAEEERKHREFFENLRDSGLKLGKLPDKIDLSPGDYSVPEEISEAANAEEVLRQAVDREASAIKLFVDLSEQVGTMTSIFDKLAAEEREHKRRLETFLPQTPNA